MLAQVVCRYVSTTPSPCTGRGIVGQICAAPLFCIFPIVRGNVRDLIYLDKQCEDYRWKLLDERSLSSLFPGAGGSGYK